MIAAAARFEAKDEAKNQPGDTNAAGKHIQKVAEVL